MHNKFAAFLFLAAATLAACGGGGGGSGAGGVGPPASTPTPRGNLPQSQTVAGAPAWVDPSSHKTLYFLDVDTAAGGTCTAACLSVWPVFVPSQNAQATGNMTIVTRSDATSQQWSFEGHPLYTYSGDSGPAQANGDGIPDFGGHWHISRPSSATSTPDPGSSSPPCSGIYC